MSSSIMGSGDGGGDYFVSHSNQASQNAITAFLTKLWALVNDSSCDDLIAWDPSGGSFHVFDQARFSREILPRYFKHNNFASFIRQLNMYGFRKISSIEHGSLKNERDDIEFAHPNFIRGQDTLLELIKRRAPDNQQKTSGSSQISGGSSTSSALVSTNYLDSKSNRPLEFHRVLDDVRNLQTKQTSLSDKLFHMQNENEALWREIGSLRQKHNKQQQIVSKLMEFLLHFITNSTTQQDQQQQNLHQQVQQQPLDDEIITESPQQQEQEQQEHHHHHHHHHHQQHHSNNSTILPNDLSSSNNSLKRKPAALMLSEEPKKRSMQQQSTQMGTGSSDQYQPSIILPHQSLNVGRQQSVTINELTDNDSTGWLHTTNTSPLVDLVPSPPPASHSVDDNYHHQQHNDYGWTVTTDDLLNPNGPPPESMDFTRQHKSATTGNTYRTTGNGSGTTTTSFVPDFFLRPNSGNNINTNVGQSSDNVLHGHSNTGITTSRTSPSRVVPVPTILKEEQIEYPNIVQLQQPSTNPTELIYSQKLLGEQQQQQQNVEQNIATTNTTEPIVFSLDDINGDVDHIQTSLDNIRELMFANLPDGTSIDDLFCDENALLSPLLNDPLGQRTTTNPTSANDVQPTKTSNLLTGNFHQQKTLSSANNELFTFPIVAPLAAGVTGDRTSRIVDMAAQVPIDNGASRNLPSSSIPLVQTQSILSTNPIDDGQVHVPASMPTHDQLLEQLLCETVKVEEQRNEIDELERKNSDLQEKIYMLEYQQHNTNKKK